MRRLPAAATLLLTVAITATNAVPARAGVTSVPGVVEYPSPLAGVANATMRAFESSGCNLADPTVRALQGTDGYVVDMGGNVNGSVSVVASGAAPSAVGVPVPATDVDVYFFEKTATGCAYAGSLAHPGNESGKPQRCTFDFVTFKQQCDDTTPRYAIVTVTSGVTVPFVISWGS